MGKSFGGIVSVAVIIGLYVFCLEFVTNKIAPRFTIFGDARNGVAKTEHSVVKFNNNKTLKRNDEELKDGTHTHQMVDIMDDVQCVGCLSGMSIAGQVGPDLETIEKSPALKRIYKVLEQKNLTDRWNDMQVILYMQDTCKNVPTCGKGEDIVVREACDSYPKNICVHVGDMLFYNVSDIVVFNVFYDRVFPSWRPEGQKWVEHDYEAPPQCEPNWPANPFLEDIKDKFNISSLFSYDSEPQFRATPEYEIDWQKYKQIKDREVDFTANKTKAAVWMVSHCETQSEREGYVHELQEHVDVDIFGRCGQKMCSNRTNRGQDCEIDLLKQYHFYLSFENSLCENYVTEKLFKIYDNDLPIIPIVLGLAKYSNFLAPSTYLDVRDFASPEDLASWMKEMMNTKKTYNEFMARKLSVHKMRMEGYPCRLCDYAHKNKHRSQKLQDITAFWSVERRCIDPRKLVPGAFWDHWKEIEQA